MNYHCHIVIALGIRSYKICVQFVLPKKLMFATIEFIINASDNIFQKDETKCVLNTTFI